MVTTNPVKYLSAKLILLVLFLQFSAPVLSQDGEQQALLSQNIQTFIDTWLSAWQAQNTDDYLASYHGDFEPDGNQDINTWRQTRLRNISRPERIVITRDALNIIDVTEDSAQIQLSFLYQSPIYADRTEKAVSLAILNGNVTGIVQERNLSVAILPEARLVIESPQPAENVVDASEPIVNEGEEQAGITDNTEPQLPVLTNEVIPEAISEVIPEVLPVEEEIRQDGSAVVDQPESSANETASSNETTSSNVATTTSNADWVPPGFENLNQPQVTEIDVYYGGYFLTSVLAEFTNQEVSILDTAHLTGQLTNLKNPEFIQSLLEAPLDAHSELLCFSEFQSDCGTLETDSVEVIFDRSLLRMWLFVSPEMLQDADVNIVRFLPPSEAGLSFMNQSAAYFTTQEFSLDTYNVFNNTLFAWGENRFSMRSNLVSDEGFDVDTLAYFREFQGKDYRLGLVREDANGFSFMGNERFAGASYASSLLTRTDLERSLGNEIELYFSTRSRVEIYREGRLISSQYYSVGNQLLDTSDLPNGSYTIEIRIFDAAGNRTVEERYYSKTANIPPADQSLYFLHVGRLENDLDTNRLSRTGQDEVMVRGGFSKRLGQSLGGNIGFSVVEDTSFLEMGLFKQGQNYELQANAAYENTGASGLDLRLRFRHPLYNLIINGRQVFNGLKESQIGQEYQQYNAMVEFPTRYGFYSFFHRHVSRPGNEKNLNSGFRYRSRTSEIFGGTFSNNFELSKNGDEVLALWNFNWFIQGNNKSSFYSPTVAYANEDAARDSGLYGTYETNWFRGEQGGNEYIYSLRGDYDSQSSLEARMQADTNLGTADIMGRYNEVNDQVEFNGRISTSFATTGNASAIGGKRRSESAFLVRVEGDIEADALFNVVVNGTVRGQVKADETVLIPVAPYYTYDVELQNVGETLVDLDNRSYRETMYPGNVVNLSWTSQVINIAIGRLVNEAGEALANAVIQNVVGIALADDNGVFQAEINQDTSRLEVQQGNFRCVAEFDNPRVTDTILPLGTLVCR